jgi:hypothetical protein
VNRTRFSQRATISQTAMIDIFIAALPYLISAAASLAGYHLSGFIRQKWIERRP